MIERERPAVKSPPLLDRRPVRPVPFLPMRMTSKGQVTIPQELRERYGLGPGAEVEVVAGEGPDPG